MPDVNIVEGAAWQGAMRAMRQNGGGVRRACGFERATRHPPSENVRDVTSKRVTGHRGVALGWVDLSGKVTPSPALRPLAYSGFSSAAGSANERDGHCMRAGQCSSTALSTCAGVMQRPTKPSSRPAARRPLLKARWDLSLFVAARSTSCVPASISSMTGSRFRWSDSTPGGADCRRAPSRWSLAPGSELRIFV